MGAAARRRRDELERWRARVLHRGSYAQLIQHGLFRTLWHATDGHGSEWHGWAKTADAARRQAWLAVPYSGEEQRTDSGEEQRTDSGEEQRTGGETE